MSGDTSSHLSAGDAKFVDVIHSDGGFFGIPWALGHADFYPNGGVALQPGIISELDTHKKYEINNVVFFLSSQDVFKKSSRRTTF